MKLIFWTLVGLWVVPAAEKYIMVYQNRRKSHGTTA